MIVSVGMIAYQAEPFIASAIRSTYDFVDEIVVVDGSAQGASTDGTRVAAMAVGPKVSVISGTFKRSDGAWDEQAQRQCYMDVMERGEDRWCIYQDADEFYTEENITKMLDYMRNAPMKQVVLPVPMLNFWVTVDQVITGGLWSFHRRIHHRLLPEMRMVNHDSVGFADGKAIYCDPDSRVNIDSDLICHHYGHALSRERRLLRKRESLPVQKELLNYTDLEEYLKSYEERMDGAALNSLVPFTGEHPDSVLPLIGTYFKSGERVSHAPLFP